MKKALLGIFMLLVLASCTQKEVEDTNPPVEDEIVIETVEETPKEEREEFIETKTVEELTEEEIQERRSQITMDELYHLYNDDVEGKNAILSEGKMFVQELREKNTKKITQYVNGGLSEADLQASIANLNEKMIRDFRLSLTILDQTTKRPVSEGTVFVNNVNMGKFTNGKFEKEFQWAKGVERFHIVVRSPRYGDAFLDINSINLTGKLLKGSVSMKQAIVKNVDITEGADLQEQDFSIAFDQCALIDSSGRCVREAVEAKMNYIEPNDVNQGEASLNMVAITNDGSIETLQSGGMAFVDFIKDEEILQVKEGKTIRITYDVSPEIIAEMKGRPGNTDDKNGYWWYDKNTGLWKEVDAEVTIDSENNTFSVETQYLY